MKPTFKQVTKTRYVQLVSELAQEIFVQHYTKLTPKVAAALADPKVQKFTEGKNLVKTILVPNKLVNLIAK